MSISNQDLSIENVIKINSLIGSTCESLNVEAYLVGGFIRDYLLGRSVNDIDIVVCDKPKAIAEDISTKLGATYFLIDSNAGIYRINVQYESAMLNIDIGIIDKSIYHNLSKRDFTIDAMAVKLDSKFCGIELNDLIDPYGGFISIQNRVIKAVSDFCFQDDPLRLLRCIRLYAQLDFEIDQQTMRMVIANVEAINQVSSERSREEIFKILSLPKLTDHLHILDKVGLLGALIPELNTTRNVVQPKEHYWDVFEHSLNAAGMVEKIFNRTHELDFVKVSIPKFPDMDIYFNQKISDSQTRLTFLKFTALLHDIGKPSTNTLDSSGKIRFLTHSEVGSVISNGIMNRLRISKRGIDIVEGMIKNHLRPAQMSQSGDLPTDKAIYKYFRDVGEVAIDTLYLDLADYLAMRGPNLENKEWLELCNRTDYIIKQYMCIEKRQKEEITVLLNGNEIMEKFDLMPGPKIGALIAKIKEAQALGDIKSRDEALKFVESNI